jgi:hypothetical protein
MLAIKGYIVDQVLDGKQVKFYIQTAGPDGQPLPLKDIPKFDTFAGLKSAAYRGQLPNVHVGKNAPARSYTLQEAVDAGFLTNPKPVEDLREDKRFTSPTLDQLFGLMTSAVQAYFENLSDKEGFAPAESLLLGGIRDRYHDISGRYLDENQILSTVASEARRLKSTYSDYVKALFRRESYTQIGWQQYQKAAPGNPFNP